MEVRHWKKGLLIILFIGIAFVLIAPVQGSLLSDFFSKFSFTGWTVNIFAGDSDGDGVPDGVDNCVTCVNPLQTDSDFDGIGDDCDNCFTTFNPTQTDSDSDCPVNVCQWKLSFCGDVCDFDRDGDSVNNSVDNCPDNYNPDQSDTDSDGVGDACDNCTDSDSDGYGNSGFNNTGCAEDNCPDISNPDQNDTDSDGQGNACDNCTDTDGDGSGNSGFNNTGCAEDNCPNVSNPSQADADNDTLGDACDNCTDTDGDGFGNSGFNNTGCATDNCLNVSNPDQNNTDSDLWGDACDVCSEIASDNETDADNDTIIDISDLCPCFTSLDNNDADNDSVGDVCDNCNITYNPDQADWDLDGTGDECDNCTDPDSDTLGEGPDCAGEDNCPNDYNPSQADADNDTIGDVCDNCVNIANTNQSDADSDNIGDSCDTCTDYDNDTYGVGAGCSGNDDCPFSYDPTQINSDADSYGDVCDNCPSATNENQADTDLDDIGDACDNCTDIDNDTYGTGAGCSGADNCPAIYNPSQANSDSDSHGDTCDNCPSTDNDDQADADSDGIGNACDDCTDPDNDTYCSSPQTPTDNCPSASNPAQTDTDNDTIGDACDNCPNNDNADQLDSDNDGIGDSCDTCTDMDNDTYGAGAGCSGTDNCPIVNNPTQANLDNDTLGDACDNCPSNTNENQTDTDLDDIGDACDNCTDVDNDTFGDGVGCSGTDNCPNVYDPTQQNSDADSYGDVCDNCPSNTNENQVDSDFDGIGDTCDNCTDVDGDGYGLGLGCLGTDNCPSVSNPNQNDVDVDTVGDACDNCLNTPNTDQADSDHNGVGDACDICADSDNDTICNSNDNCPNSPNQNQADSDNDTIGDVCDNCVYAENPSQANSDNDTLGNACDNCPNVDNQNQVDSDGDSIGDTCDNCPNTSNANQLDSDHDGIGDACDTCTDLDNDTICDDVDNCPNIPNTNQTDTDIDGVGDACDICANTPTGCEADDSGCPMDGDADGVCNGKDQCPGTAAGCAVNATTGCSYDADKDGVCNEHDQCANTQVGCVPSANGCPTDIDGDGICNGLDNCLNNTNANQADSDNDNIGDVCDNCLNAFNFDQANSDNDTFGDACDNCPNIAANSQADYDRDGIGDACDNCMYIPNTNQNDSDSDGVGNACDDCPTVDNPDQADQDLDRVGNLCDNCPSVGNTNQADADSDGSGDVCDACEGPNTQINGANAFTRDNLGNKITCAGTFELKEGELVMFTSEYIVGNVSSVEWLDTWKDENYHLESIWTKTEESTQADSDIYKADLNGHVVNLINDSNEGPRDGSLGDIVANSNTSLIAFSSDRSTDGFHDIWRMNKDGGNAIRLTERDEREQWWAWSADGSKLVYSVSVQEGENYQYIHIVDSDGKNHKQLTDGGNDGNPKISHDGTKIVFQQKVNDIFDIVTIDVDGNGRTQLTSGNDDKSSPQWAPDDSKIYYFVYPVIFVMDQDGSNQTQLTPNDSTVGSEYDLSFDGKIVFLSNRTGNNDVWVMDPDGSNQTNLTFDDSEKYRPAWSPDGTKIAFISNEAGYETIWVMNEDGSNKYQLTTFGTRSFAWVNNSYISFASTELYNMTLYDIYINLLREDMRNIDNGTAIVRAFAPGAHTIEMKAQLANGTNITDTLVLDVSETKHTEEKTIAVILAKFSDVEPSREGDGRDRDGDGNTTDDDGWDAYEYKNLILSQVNNYYEEVSNGKHRFDFKVFDNDGEWYEIKSQSTYDVDSFLAVDAAVSKVTLAGDDPDNWMTNAFHRLVILTGASGKYPGAKCGFPPGCNKIFVYEEYGVDVFAHELGHSLGVLDLYGFGVGSMVVVGDVGDWDIMGTGSGGLGGEHPPHMTLWTKTEEDFLGEVKYNLSTGVTVCPSVEDPNKVVFWQNPDTWGSWVYYIVEGRNTGRSFTYWDRSAPKSGAVVFRLRQRILPFLEYVATFKPGGNSYFLGGDGVEFKPKNQSFGADGVTPCVDITYWGSPKMVGAVLEPNLEGLVGEINKSRDMMAPIEQTVGTDLDLHAYYAILGNASIKHAGMNYYTDSYDCPEDALCSGDKRTDEWIFVPANATTVNFTVTNRDTKKFLDYADWIENSTNLVYFNGTETYQMRFVKMGSRYVSSVGYGSLDSISGNDTVVEEDTYVPDFSLLMQIPASVEVKEPIPIDGFANNTDSVHAWLVYVRESESDPQYVKSTNISVSNGTFSTNITGSSIAGQYAVIVQHPGADEEFWEGGQDLLDDVGGVLAYTENGSSESDDKFAFDTLLITAVGEEGGGGAGPAPAATFILTGLEQNFELNVGDEIDFDIGGVSHKLRVLRIFDNSVEFEILSPINLTLTTGETKQVDVNENGVNDLEITLNSIIGSKVDISVKKLVEEVAPATPAPTKPAEEVKEEEPSQPTAPPAEKEVLFNSQTIMTIAIVVAILISFAATLIAKRKKYVAPAVTAEEKLEGYVGRQLAIGRTEFYLRQKLLDVGWKEETINRLFDELRGKGAK